MQVVLPTCRANNSHVSLQKCNWKCIMNRNSRLPSMQKPTPSQSPITVLPSETPSNERSSTAHKCGLLCAPDVWQKLEPILVIKTSIALPYLPNPRSTSNFPILQRNGHCSTGNLVSNSSSRFLLHIVKDSYLKNMRPSDSPSCRSRLKNLVGCYY